MKLLRNIRISQRIWLILIIALVSTLTAEGLSLSHLHKEIREAESPRQPIWCKSPMT